MESQKPLFLHEEIMLLALRNRKNTPEPMVRCSYALGAAVLAELMLQKRITVEEPYNKRFVNPRSARLMGDPIINECLKRITAAKRRASLQTWISRFSGVKNLKHRVAMQLVRRGILRVGKEKVLSILKGQVHPELDPLPERGLIQQLRSAIFTPAQDLDPRTAILIALAFNTGLLKVPFSKRKLRARQARIDRIIRGELIGEAAQAASEAAQAAVMVACIMPAVLTVTLH
jgi:hypothetical protein